MTTSEITSTKNILRIQKTYQALSKLRKDQIEKSNSNQSLAELRLKMYSNLKQHINKNQSRLQFQSDFALNSLVKPQESNPNANQKWNAFGTLPYYSFNQQKNKLENQYIKRIEQYRQVARKQQLAKIEKMVPQPQQKNINLNKQPPKGNDNIFSAVYSNQKGPFANLSANSNKPLFGQNSNQNISIFGKKNTQNNLQSPSFGSSIFQKKQEESNKNQIKNVIAPIQEVPIISINPIKSSQVAQNIVKKPEAFSIQNPISKGFTLPGNQTQLKPNITSVFTRKFQVPEGPYIEPVINGSLFSQFNPLSGVNTSINMSLFGQQNEKKTQQIQPKKPLNIFQNNIKLDQSTKLQESKPNISLFANVKGDQSDKKLPTFGLFSQSQTQVSEQKPLKPQIENKEVQNKNEKVFQQKQSSSIFGNAKSINSPSFSLFGENKPKENIFGNSTVVDNKNQNNPQMFKNFSIPTPTPLITPFSAGNSLFTKQAQKKPSQNKIGSLFSNSNTPLIPESKNQGQKKQNQSLNKFDTLKSNEPDIKKTNQEPTKNIFLNNSLFGNKPSISIQANVNNPLQVNTQNIFSNLKHQTQPKPSLFNLNPTQTAKVNEQSQPKNEDSQKSITKKKATQIFGDFVKSKPGDMFSKDSNKQGKQAGIFGNTGGLFGSKNDNPLFGNPGSSTTGIFGNLSSNSLFGNSSANQNSSLFGKPKKQAQQEDQDQQNGQQDEEQGIIDNEQIDPTKSTGNYKYEQSTIIYRETISKFKKGNNNIVENVIISIQKYKDAQNYLLCVRLQNKCDYFTGTVLSGITQVSKINQNDSKNLLVKKIVSIGEDKQPKPEILKLQFKEPAQGAIFFQKFKEISKKVQNK